jgi:hypothetical protein
VQAAIFGVLLMAVISGKQQPQLLGTMETLDGLDVSSIQIFNKVIYSNGHARRQSFQVSGLGA